MTLTEYKRQAQEIAEILMNFSGKEEEAEKFAKNLLEKYREFGEFNSKALECKDLAEFKNLADANGMKIESKEAANELFLGLSKGKKEVEKTMLNMEDLAAVTGGGRQGSIWGRLQGFAAVGAGIASFISLVVGAVAGAFNDDAPILESLSYGTMGIALATLGGALAQLPGTILPGTSD